MCTMHETNNTQELAKCNGKNGIQPFAVKWKQKRNEWNEQTEGGKEEKKKCARVKWRKRKKICYQNAIIIIMPVSWFD